MLLHLHRTLDRYCFVLCSGCRKVVVVVPVLVAHLLLVVLRPPSWLC